MQPNLLVLITFVLLSAVLMIQAHRRANLWAEPMCCALAAPPMGWCTCYGCGCLALPVLGLATALFAGLLLYLGTEKRAVTGVRRGLYKLEFSAVTGLWSIKKQGYAFPR